MCTLQPISGDLSAILWFLNFFTIVQLQTVGQKLDKLEITIFLKLKLKRKNRPVLLPLHYYWLHRRGPMLNSRLLLALIKIAVLTGVKYKVHTSNYKKMKILSFYVPSPSFICSPGDGGRLVIQCMHHNPKIG